LCPDGRVQQASKTIALDDLSHAIIRAQRTRTIILSPAVTIPHTAPRLPASTQSQGPLPKSRTKPRRLLRRHVPDDDSADGDDDGKPPDEGPPPHLPLLMKIEEVMFELGVSRRTVYSLIRDGHLTLVRIGERNTRIRTEEVLNLAGTSFKPLRVARLRNQTSETEDTRNQTPETEDTAMNAAQE